MLPFFRRRTDLLEFKKSVTDAIILFSGMIITLAFFHYIDATEKVYEITRNYEHFGLDEFILTLAITPFFLSIYIARRFNELKQALVKANTDPLMGITNRRRGSELIREEMLRVTGAEAQSTLIMFDLDNFKYVNDTFGHDAGDRVLQQIARIAQEESRNIDLLIRWGGEEFLMLCPDTDLDSAQQIAERLRSAFEINNVPGVGCVTASFGVTNIYPDENLRKLINRVDENLYTSKKNGKNRITAI